jgi:hypothetical protein
MNLDSHLILLAVVSSLMAYLGERRVYQARVRARLRQWCAVRG